MPLSAGTRLGPYEIQAAISAGGMGEVYRARDTRLDRLVAITILPPQFAIDPLREVTALYESLGMTTFAARAAARLTAIM